MRCPTLSELPPPPPGRTGWPWTEESPQLPDTMPDGRPWPRVSIVTPSYNQAQFIEETIRSVLLQGYPNLEYIIIDGGSTDGSVEIIRKYAPWLAYWVSEPDRGQSHAINKGWSIASGDLYAWINSDDRYKVNALANVTKVYIQNAALDLMYGDCELIDAFGSELAVFLGDYSYTGLLDFWQKGLYYGITQQASFFSCGLIDRLGYLAEDLHYLMDYEYFLRAGPTIRANRVDHVIASFRLHDSSKSTKHVVSFAKEYATIIKWYPEVFCPKEQRRFLRGINRRYAELIIASVLKGSFSDRRSAFTAINRALLLCPQMLKERWVRLLWVKTLLGEQAYGKVRQVLRYRIGANLTHREIP
jgi:glycosyltransferase involved in cell wall biosynthesis